MAYIKLVSFLTLGLCYTIIEGRSTGEQVSIPEHDVKDRCSNNSVTAVSCENANSTNYLLPHPDNCELFYYCISADQLPICRQCPANLHFNPVEHVCDLPERAGCTADKLHGLKSSIKYLNAIINNLSDYLQSHKAAQDIPLRCITNSVTNVTCDSVETLDNLVPHPDDCQLFYYCVSPDLAPICRQCPAELHFNPAKHVCDLPADAGCTIKFPANLTISA